MRAFLDLIDDLWSRVKAWKQQRAGADVVEGDKLRHQLDTEAAEIKQRAGQVP